MSRARWILEQNDPALVVTSIIEAATIDIQRLTVIAAIADDGPRGRDAFAAGNSHGWNARSGLPGGLAGIAQRQRSGLSAAKSPLIDVAAPAPVLCGTVVVVKLDDEVMAGSIAEGH
jgi:hypothetical protein